MTRQGDHFSHRGRGMLLFGIIWIIIGLATILRPSFVEGPMSILPIGVRGGIWMATGALALAAVLTGAAHPRTKYAFIALVLPTSLRAISYLLDLVAALLSPLHIGSIDINHAYGHTGSWLDALVWAIVTLFVLHEASAPVVPPSLTPERPSR